MELKIRKYSWQLAPSAIRDIRQTVFIDEQGVPADLEWDETDEISDHFIGVLPDNTPVAVARLVPSVTDVGHIGRMAILREHRGRGYGEQMLRHIMQEAASQFDQLHLSAQQYAVPFYEKLGFHVCSTPYDDAGIPHLDMRCLAAPQILAGGSRTHNPTILGRDDSTWHFAQEGEYHNLLDTVAGQASQRIWLYDRLLEHDLYDRQRLRDIFSEMARRHRVCEIRLLVHDDKPLVQRRHQLVQLMKRLPSKIELRLVNPDYPSEEQAFLLADRDALAYRHRFDSLEGWARFADSGRVKLQAEAFQRMWDTARPSLELRELPL
ncbi:GNAT family N-acetyltransferase [Marinobacter halodurans]|uniref:GNAT family N-acetyltransferase n=1 Tax=Marinobacter halodurans TaxID=2528979 RepID=A0ABY1ZUK3_9GAMM|nr:GNAT family N-acetyltransferase [Marinobacter halodurans]TBW59140.1 GNAT family N-acetyltransferase [Marinobacter halodurans]